jgi:hypothetical protein
MVITKNKADKKLIKWALEESPVPVVRNPVLKKAITDAEIQKRLDKQRGPSDWDIIYSGMSPQEKGSWNYEQRKKGMDGKRAIPLKDIKKKKPTEPVKINFDLDIRRVAKKPKPKPVLPEWDWREGVWFDLQDVDPYYNWKPKPPEEETKIPKRRKERFGLAYLLQA